MAPTSQPSIGVIEDAQMANPAGRYKDPKLSQARQVFDSRGKQIAALLDRYDVPDEKVTPVVEYGIKLLSTNPQMKNIRIVRKVADKYHLKLK